jgi:uncharacterized membrane protein YbhN (UPF0104 family)
MRRQLGIGIGISIVALYLALLGIDLPQVKLALSQAEYVYLIPAALAVLAGVAARSVRWQLLLGPGVSLERTFWVTGIGYLASNVLPFRLGDPIRAVVIGRGNSVSTASALSTVVVERVLDMLTVVTLLAGLAPFIGGAGKTMGAGMTAGSVALLAWVVLMVMAFRPGWGQWLARQFLQWVPGLDLDRWMHIVDGLFEGLVPLRSGRRWAGLLIWSLLTWACVTGSFWSMLRAFLTDFQALTAPFLVSVAALGMAVPASPGAVGVFQATIRYGLTEVFEVPVDRAIAVAFGIHIVQYVLGCLLGLIGLWRESLSLSWLRDQVAMKRGAGLDLGRGK